MVVLSPKITQIVDPEDEEHATDLPALVAAESAATVTFEMSAEE
jgi:hypothetical protein